MRGWQRPDANRPYTAERGTSADTYCLSGQAETESALCFARQSLWTGTTAQYRAILERIEYCGHTVNFKTHRQSYKIKKTIENPPDQWKIFRNTHEAIVDEETFDRVQELRRNKRRPAKTGKSNLFSGIAYCADCGEKLYYCTTQNFEERQDHFVCSTSRKKGKDVCGTHFIRAMVLEKGVLKFLQILLWYISDCEDLFREKLGAKRKEEFKKELAAKRRQLTQAQRRIEELDRLFKRIYEDNISGKINDSRFQKLSADYEKEQAELTEKMQTLGTRDHQAGRRSGQHRAVHPQSKEIPRTDGTDTGSPA